MNTWSSEVEPNRPNVYGLLESMPEGALKETRNVIEVLTSFLLNQLESDLDSFEKNRPGLIDPINDQIEFSNRAARFKGYADGIVAVRRILETLDISTE